MQISVQLSENTFMEVRNEMAVFPDNAVGDMPRSVASMKTEYEMKEHNHMGDNALIPTALIEKHKNSADEDTVNTPIDVSLPLNDVTVVCKGVLCWSLY